MKKVTMFLVVTGVLLLSVGMVMGKHHAIITPAIEHVNFVMQHKQAWDI